MRCDGLKNRGISDRLNDHKIDNKDCDKFFQNGRSHRSAFAISVFRQNGVVVFTIGLQ
jgi:hypothetical protein